MTDEHEHEHEHAIKLAKVIAKALGDNFSDAFKNKQRWTAKRGMSGGRFRDVNEPFQDDYIAAAKAAAAVIAADRAGLVARIAELEEGLNAILDRGPERDKKWFGMTAKDIARAALKDTRHDADA